MEGALSPQISLVVLQFSFAIILIISTVIVLRQINYAQNRDAGYDKDNIVFSFMQGDITKNYVMIRNELISNGVATEVTRTSQPMTEHWSDTWGFEWPGSTPNDLKADFNYFASDNEFVHHTGFKINRRQRHQHSCLSDGFKCDVVE